MTVINILAVKDFPPVKDLAKRGWAIRIEPFAEKRMVKGVRLLLT
jgi:hypothetical protein